MPWRETHKMDQRIEFALRAVNCSNFGELCREYGISRKTGYKWRERFLEGGFGGMAERSRRPKGHARELPEEVVCRVVRLKHAHPQWGPRKIRALYGRKFGGEPPSESSFKRVLERAGLTRPRRRRKVWECGRVAGGRKASAPNEVWTVDFKGWWRDREGLKVEPLTVRDEHSRMVLEVRALADTRTATVRACFERLFESHGLPGAIRSDNGPPFASPRAVHGLSRLSAWWLALGIGLERGRPGRPQDNGAHERLHRDVVDEFEAVRASGDQDAFELWRHGFNNERPHEALGMRVPAEVYRPSERPYEGTPDSLDYGGMATRRVNAKNGTVRYRNDLIPISRALGGWDVGIAPLVGGRAEVWFTTLLLGHLDPLAAAFTPSGDPAAPAAPAPAAGSATLHRPQGPGQHPTPSNTHNQNTNK